MLDWVPSAPYTAEQLLEVLRILRDPENGCPWDKVQTHASIRKDFLEAGIEIRPRNIHFFLIHIHRLRGRKLPRR